MGADRQVMKLLAAGRFSLIGSNRQSIPKRRPVSLDRLQLHAAAGGDACTDANGDGCCDVCGVHLEDCPDCDGVGYHRAECPQNEENHVKGGK